MMKPWMKAAVFALVGTTAYADDNAIKAGKAAYDWRKANEHQILNEFRDLLSMPNVATDLDDMARNADWIEAYIAKRGFSYQRLSAGGAPYVYGERKTPGATQTLLIYAHFDGQPVQPENWASPPFTPTLRAGTVESGAEEVAWPAADTPIDPEWRLYARSAGDDKAPVVALMAAVDALEAAGIAPLVNIKLIFDGEEERGSPTLEPLLEEYGHLLDADLMIFCDGPMHQSRQRQLVFGVRGTRTVHLTTYGPARPLHSGHYGNWAPNPNHELVRLLSSLHDRNGNIAVDGYLEDMRPVTDAEAAAVAAMPNIDKRMKAELALGRTDLDGARLEAAIMQPAIVVKGIAGGGAGPGKSRNIIQPSATASLNLRLVPGQTPAGVEARLNSHFKAQGYHVVFEEPDAETLMANERVLYANWSDSGYPAYRSDLTGSQSEKMQTILAAVDGKQPLLTPTMGGSLPIYLFDKHLKLPVIILPVANHDNNQHGRNENMRLQNLWDAIPAFAAVLAAW